MKVTARSWSIGQVALLVILFCTLCWAVPGQAAGLATIRVVMDDNYPPYVFRDERGGLKGITIDQWRLWEKRTGIRVELSGMDWGEAQRCMQAGEFDVIDTIFRNEKRDKLYDFTKPYANIPVPLYFHADISGIRGPEDARGFLVAAKAGGNVIDVLKRHGVTSIVEYPSYEKIVEAARDNRVKIFTVDRPPAHYYLNKFGIQDRFRESPPMYSGEFHRAVAKGRKDLLAAVEKGFAAITPAEYAAIDERWMGRQINGLVQLRMLWYAVGAMGAAGALVLVWLVMLKRAVRRTTRDLAESEQRYRTIIDDLPDVYYRTDAAGCLTMISPSGVVLLGFDDAAEMMGLPVASMYLNPGERAIFLRKLKEQGRVYGYEVTLKRKDGSQISVATSSHQIFTADGTFAGVEGIFRDISRQREAEAELRASEHKFSTTFNQAPLLMTISDIDTGRYLEVNEKFCQISGFSRDEVAGRTSLELGWISADERERMLAVLRSEGRVLDLEMPLTAKDGHQVICLYSAEIIDVGGKQRLLSIAQDITRRKQIEALLAENEERYRWLVEKSAAWIWRIDRNMKQTYSNDYVTKVLGYVVDEFKQLDIMDLVHPDDHRLLLETVEAAFGGREWNGVVLRWLARDGSWHYIESSGGPVYDGKGTCIGLQGVDIDITERRQLQQEQEKNQRLESLGLLAGGIAHDFNNILTGIIGNLSLTRVLVAGDTRASERLAQSEKAAMRAAELTRQLLTFARGGEPVKKAVEVHRLVHEAVQFALRGSNVKGVLELPDDLWNIHADESQINQALNNLLINAVQAMPEGGTVTVTGENVESDQRWVRLTVTDTGSGIPADLLSRVFDPYFTTKANGTGLGLASVHSIVTRHGGTVSVTSRLGTGAEFAISLPATGELSHAEAGSAGHSGMEGVAGRRVLVMDDEELIRGVLADMLSELGCVAELCDEGETAVELFRTALEAGRPYGAVILDLTIPGGMGGLEAAHRIRELDSGARLIVSSGYCNDAVAADLTGHGFDGMVMKPYNLQEFTNELARVLGRP